ncbi:uncharacterized protein Z518_02117 [Rhinocladiella mackenziei CBS 650.93]|uniref:Alpha,alpha-trehalase n=1 Tax=Rhinocladiella mackenziei CBS 650.93 TaxID=1442369 RepID=A0A0D2INU4_9EURO|nr:uncharacterized protein Z518_02117 [Rhinocladiella mackenziei CBS 650.93]KIX07464.1 hypothetical protein Z518_02117 [Rhinocladiella mackenziei CBS 650.93]
MTLAVGSMIFHHQFHYVLQIVLTTTALVSAVPYQEYILAPTSRTLHPVSVRTVNGTVLNASSLAKGQGGTTFASDYVGFTFSESSIWISGQTCDSTTGDDEPLWFPVTREVRINNHSVYFTAMPHVADGALGRYSGYFHSDDNKLSRVCLVGDSGLMNVTSSADWGRVGMGGHSIEANSILYYTLNVGLGLAKIVGDASVTSIWQQHAKTIKQAANARLWDASAGLYRDNETTTLYPQDGNSWAVVSNITANSTQIALISAKLAPRWTKVGAPAPEAGSTVSPFALGFELQAHYVAGQPERAMNLMRRMWVDFMLDDPRMTNSSFIEGYYSDRALHYVPYDLDSRISHARRGP